MKEHKEAFTKIAWGEKGSDIYLMHNNVVIYRSEININNIFAFGYVWFCDIKLHDSQNTFYVLKKFIQYFLNYIPENSLKLVEF